MGTAISDFGFVATEYTHLPSSTVGSVAITLENVLTSFSQTSTTCGIKYHPDGRLSNAAVVLETPTVYSPAAAGE